MNLPYSVEIRWPIVVALGLATFLFGVWKLTGAFARRTSSALNLPARLGMQSYFEFSIGPIQLVIVLAVLGCRRLGS